MRLFPSITTTKSGLDGAFDQLHEALSLGIHECALFLTCLNARERVRFYRECLKIPRSQISFPFVHARSDMSEDEYSLLIEKFGAKRFNLHAHRIHPIKRLLDPKFRSRIFIENSLHLYKEDLIGFAGVCLDISHLEELRLTDHDSFLEICSLLDTIPIGANHISAIVNPPRDQIAKGPIYARHYSISLNDFAYLSRYPQHYFSDSCATELENTIAEQLEIIEAIEAMFGIEHVTTRAA